jgi:hypothetical protein
MKDNNIILNQVKSLVSSKRQYKKKNKIVGEKNLSNNMNDHNFLKMEINEWLRKNGEKISTEIINEHLKKIFK